jgi:CrcB protein
MQPLLFVGAGGALGSMARFLVGGWALRALGPAWPYGTLAVNVVGGGLIGLLAGFLAFRGGADQERLRLLLQVGFLGGFTTFSAFSLETGLMLQRREYVSAGLYIVASVVLSLAALMAGRYAARGLFA